MSDELDNERMRRVLRTVEETVIKALAHQPKNESACARHLRKALSKIYLLSRICWLKSVQAAFGDRPDFILIDDPQTLKAAMPRDHKSNPNKGEWYTPRMMKDPRFQKGADNER